MLLIFPCCDSDYRPNQLQNMSSEIYDLLVKAFKVREDSSSITIFGFLKKRKETIFYPFLILVSQVVKNRWNSFIACKNHDKTISAVRTCKSYGPYVEHGLQQQSKDTRQAKRILLVNDEDDINLTVKLVSGGSGFKVDSFTNPRLALLI
jgi:hypothetical protein